MCGIVAVLAQAAIDEGKIDEALRALRHRGPDGARRWVSAARDVALGHARLSVIDLQTGAQPVANEDGRIRAIVNGEFYDFERIRRELEARGHRLRTQSDSEILVHLYEDFGVSSLQHLRGEFAFALWDEQSQRLFCGRDRLGVKPLFHAVHHGAHYFASEMKALFALGVPARWDLESYVQSIALGSVLPDRTLFAGIGQVPAGHYMLVSRTNARTVKYWDLDLARTESDPAHPAMTDAEAIAELRGALEEAVRLRLRADVPVACYLSGGIDSCSILALAARNQSRPVPAFTVSFDDVAYDEVAIAQETADACGAELVPVRVTQRDLAGDLRALVWHAEQPIANANAVAKFRLSRFVRDAGFKVVLTGEGADEVLAGYPHFRRDNLLYDHAGASAADVAGGLADLERTNRVSRGLLLPGAGGQAVAPSVVRRLGFLPSFLEVGAVAAAGARPYLAPEVLRRFGDLDAVGALLDGLDTHAHLDGRPPVHRSLYLWAKTGLPNYILSVLGDRVEMAHGVEGRLPFLDHPLVERVARMPVSLKIRGTVEKYVLREAMRPLLTPTVYARQKHPFLAPPSAQALTGPLFELMIGTLRGSALRNLPFYDVGAVLRLLDYLPSIPAAERTSLDAGLMAMTSLCLLGDVFNVGA